MFTNCQTIVAVETYWSLELDSRRNAGPGTFLTLTRPGRGKTHANMQRILQAASSVTLVKTHRYADEILDEYRACGIEAVKYPKLLETNCQKFQEARAVQGLGLNLGATLCTKCEHADTCPYRGEIRKAENAKHSVCTHDRARVRPKTLSEVELVVIEEDCVDLLSPLVRATSGFDNVSLAAFRALMATPDFRPEQQEAFRHIQEIADYFGNVLSTADKHQELVIPEPVKYRKGIELAIYENLPPGTDKEALQIVLGCAFGRVKRIMLAIDNQIRKESLRIVPSVLTVGKFNLPKGAEVWISDGSADLDALYKLLPNATNRTPQAEVLPAQDVFQIPDDIAKRTKRANATRIVRDCLRTYCQGMRVGMIGHQEHEPEKLDLAQDERRQIKRFSYFFSPHTRGSNSWYEDLDILIIAGTPRPPEWAVRNRILQLWYDEDLIDEDHEGSFVDGLWGSYSWTGETLDGREVEITAKGYDRTGWKAAYRSIVHAELLQCLARARYDLACGIPAIVISKEPLGLKLSNRPTLPAPTEAVYQAVLSGASSVAEIANKLGKSERRVREWVACLLEYDLVSRTSRRGKICPK